ncbi:TetR/AcrR family transcriptional regulator [Dactylosporangium sp. NPDC000521]|uniref:TetR/AcrR family transcriptional regulator n=1 Tax=Dactylosporangium sp. NPDC000521 TaxID=3363975 RepID=UPI003680F3A5
MQGRERDTIRTRRAILDAATTVVGKRGQGASVDAIAQAAGVSKGGLLHHFKSRDQLLLALAEDLAEQWWAAVRAAVDPRDNAPGRLVRGYINATFDDLLDGSAASEHAVLVATLATAPGVAEVLQRDTRQWAEAFEADGLHPQRVLMIVRAADGTAVAGLFEGGTNQQELQASRQLLLALSRQDGPLIEP